MLSNDYVPFASVLGQILRPDHPPPSSRHRQDTLIAEDRLKYEMRGGCTAVVALLLLGRLYLANAGDSRATYCRRGRAVLASHDFTPETERHRVRQLVGDEGGGRRKGRQLVYTRGGTARMCAEGDSRYVFGERGGEYNGWHLLDRLYIVRY